MNKRPFVVIGGAGTVGAFLTRILGAAGRRVVIIDRQTVRRDAIEDHPLTSYVADALDLPLQYEPLLQSAAALVLALALPQETALGALKQCAPHITPTASVVNTCSVQTPFHTLAARLLANNQPVIGINPMFSPELSCAGRPVVMCEPHATAAGDQFEHWLIDAGMAVTRMGPDEHDRAMAICQTLPHAIIVAFLLSLPPSATQITNLLSLAPPPMQTLMCLDCTPIGQ